MHAHKQGVDQNIFGHEMKLQTVLIYIQTQYSQNKTPHSPKMIET